MRRMLLGLVAGALLPLAHGADGWRPLRDNSLMVAPGSVLDFSQLLPLPPAPVHARLLVTPDGRLARADAPQRPQRFLMASTGFDPSTGAFPDRTSTDLYVKQLRMRGYNMVRLHFTDVSLMVARQIDFDFNPVQLDRMHYLLAALTKAGIYYMVDGLTADTGGYGNNGMLRPTSLKLGVYFDPEAQAHWKKLIEKAYGAVNPYTGISTLADPALAGIILVNEGGLEFVTRSRVPDELREPFATWLKKKYAGTGALAKAWKSDLAPSEALEAKSVGFLKQSAWNSPRMADTQQFYVALQKTTADWMTQYLRQLGYQGLVTAYDNWPSPAAHLARSQFDWVDLHAYFSEPSKFVSPGSVMRQDSMIGDGGRYLTELAVGKQLGRAYSVSEHGQVFWNRYRRESALALPAYAAFQDWDVIAQHNGAVTLSYAERGGRKDRIYPFMVGPDPVTRAGETLAALLYLRGDVATARSTVAFQLTPSYTFQDNPFYGGIAADIAKLSLVTGFALDTGARPGGNARADALLKPGVGGMQLAGGKMVDAPASVTEKLGALAREYGGKAGDKVDNSRAAILSRASRRVAALRAAGLLSTANQSDPLQGVYQSDTGQLLMETQRRRFSVTTSHTEGVVFDTPEPQALRQLKVLEADGPALVAVSSVDSQPLASSQRMLVVLATDARNSGMRFADAAETTLQDLGSGPVQLQNRRLKLSLDNANAARLQVYAVDLRGQRGDQLAVSREGNRITFTLDTGALTQGPTTYFEITSKD
ncbi:hypothetical protein [Duganella sp. BuS-21]|uniref:hypothetical protein n=1 Tax=Duganella sp. BuS-21 TaxID=2943848 RepID=UPI0035A63124